MPIIIHHDYAPRQGLTESLGQIRHVQLVSRRKRRPVQWDKLRGPRPRRPDDYYLIVLGSGGHTKEMLMMMDDGFCDFGRFHRRYVVSSGDRMSVDHLEEYEADVRKLCEAKGSDPGSYDVKLVTRARRVHQPLWTAPLSSLQSLYDIVRVLLNPPAGTRLPFPRIILSNGPATGFLVGLAVHLLKVVYMVPEDACSFIYIESWARISSLSLSGKLIHYTGMADGLAVQHQAVAATYGIVNVGAMVFNSRRSTDS